MVTNASARKTQNIALTVENPEDIRTFYLLRSGAQVNRQKHSRNRKSTLGKEHRDTVGWGLQSNGRPQTLMRLGLMGLPAGVVPFWHAQRARLWLCIKALHGCGSVENSNHYPNEVGASTTGKRQ